MKANYKRRQVNKKSPIDWKQMTIANGVAYAIRKDGAVATSSDHGSSWTPLQWLSTTKSQEK